jgi:hypothetical protein
MSVKDLTTEQLLDMVDKGSSTVSNLADDKSNVKDFLKERDIMEGDALIPNYKIYHDYCKEWNPRGKKLSKIQFFRTLSKIFESKRTKDTRYYLLAKEAFDLGKEAIDEAKRFDERYRRKISKKRQSQKTSEISSTPEEVQS